MKIKINRWAKKFSFLEKDVRSKILSDSMFACIFAKDPKKMNFYEKMASEYLTKNLTQFNNLANNNLCYIVEGEVYEGQKINDLKTIDFKWTFKGIDCFASHKYIKADGGAQDNQYNDVRNSLKEAQNIDGIKFIAICDGPYFQRNNRLNRLKEEFENENVSVLTIEEMDVFFE